MNDLNEVPAALPPPRPEPSALERAEAAAAVYTGELEGAKEIIKPSRDAEFYVGWSHNWDAPVWAGTRAEAIADGCPVSRLRRADKRGTSMYPPYGYSWDHATVWVRDCPVDGLVPRGRLADFAAAWLVGRDEEAQALIEPDDDEPALLNGRAVPGRGSAE